MTVYSVVGPSERGVGAWGLFPTRREAEQFVAAQLHALQARGLLGTWPYNSGWGIYEWPAEDIVRLCGLEDTQLRCFLSTA
jgi:hypothetical protein